MDGPSYIVCNPTTSPAYAEGAVERWCTICGDTVWMAPSSVKFHAESDAVPICIECASGLAQLESIATIEPVPGSDAEVEATLRRADEQ